MCVDGKCNGTISPHTAKSLELWEKYTDDKKKLKFKDDSTMGRILSARAILHDLWMPKDLSKYPD